MFAKIANEFQNITKFNLLQFFIDCRDFFQDDYSEIYAYFGGKTESINSDKLKKLNSLLLRSHDLIRTFQTFSGKLGNVGYWELQKYCQDLNDTLERINKLPKYLRTSKSCRGYKPYIQVAGEIGGMKTIQDLARQIGGNTTEQELILNNDLQEEDYEIDKLSQINAFVDNNTNVVVTTILEQPVGRAIYGRDIDRKISFTDNDLSRVLYEDNVEQKSAVLLELNKGDVPEMPQFGKNIVIGATRSSYNFAELARDLEENFAQDDLFESVQITDLKSDENGDIYATCEIKTKYAYSTTKNVKVL